MSFKDISYLQLWLLTYCLLDDIMEEHFCEIILSLDLWFRRCHLKILLNVTAMMAFLLGGVVPFVQVCWRAFNMRNI